MPGSSGRARGALEQEVLGCLAAAGRPLTTAEVQAGLDGHLAYTTVMTALTRLHAKGVLTRQPAGRAFAYGLAADMDEIPASLTARGMRRLLESGPDRASVLASFVADLSAEDERILSGLLEERAHPQDGGPA
jgi:predicted transcriptional regulator